MPLSSPLPRNGTAKVQRYLLSTKHFAKKVCIFNVLQQIRLFLPKFIHILSTNLAKCVIYKAKMFAFAEYFFSIAHVHYIKTNNKLYLQPFVIAYLQTY